MTGGIPARRDPMLGFRFQVEVDGLLVGGFSEVRGVELNIEVDDYHEGGVNHFVHRLPKAARMSNLVLTRGVIVTDSILWDWFEHIRQGKIERRSGRVVLLDATFEEEDHFRFLDAFPVRIQVADLNATSDAVLTEALELAHNGIVRSHV